MASELVRQPLAPLRSAATKRNSAASRANVIAEADKENAHLEKTNPATKQHAAQSHDAYDAQLLEREHALALREQRADEQNRAHEEKIMDLEVLEMRLKERTRALNEREAADKTRTLELSQLSNIENCQREAQQCAEREQRLVAREEQLAQAESACSERELAAAKREETLQRAERQLRLQEAGILGEHRISQADAALAVKERSLAAREEALERREKELQAKQAREESIYEREARVARLESALAERERRAAKEEANIAAQAKSLVARSRELTVRESGVAERQRQQEARAAKLASEAAQLSSEAAHIAAERLSLQDEAAKLREQRTALACSGKKMGQSSIARGKNHPEVEAGSFGELLRLAEVVGEVSSVATTARVVEDEHVRALAPGHHDVLAGEAAARAVRFLSEPPRSDRDASAGASCISSSHGQLTASSIRSRCTIGGNVRADMRDWDQSSNASSVNSSSRRHLTARKKIPGRASSVDPVVTGRQAAPSHSELGDAGLRSCPMPLREAELTASGPLARLTAPFSAFRRSMTGPSAT